MIDPTLLDLLTDVVRHVHLPAALDTSTLAEAQNTRTQSGFSVKPGAVPPEASASEIAQSKDAEAQVRKAA